MTRDDLSQTIGRLYHQCFDLIKKKNDDYASDKDPLSNFKFSSTVAGIKPHQAFLNLIGVKLARLNELLGNDKIPNNESIEDSIKDCINYLALLYAYIDSKKVTSMPETSYKPSTTYATIEKHVSNPKYTSHSLNACEQKTLPIALNMQKASVHDADITWTIRSVIDTINNLYGYTYDMSKFRVHYVSEISEIHICLRLLDGYPAEVQEFIEKPIAKIINFSKTKLTKYGKNQ